MLLYPIFLEIFLYGAAFYLFGKKNDMILVYLPLLFFTRGLVEEPAIRAMIWYFLITFFIVFSSLKTNPVRKLNIWAVLLFGYLTVLYINSGNMSSTRSSYFSMVCLIGAFVVVPGLYRRYGREAIFEELYKMSLVVLLVFCVNTLFSTITGYNPNPLYGRTTGVLYGNMGATGFMLVPLSMFLCLMRNLKRTSLIDMVLIVLSFGFLLLTFRRTAALAATLAIVAFLFMLVMQRDQKKTVLVGGSLILIAIIGAAFTGFSDQFSERYEERFEDRELVHADEGRFTDHTMVYEDIFVYERYSFLFGHSFFNSAGNYGGGVREGRTLHPDLPVIVHASGLIGLFLYLGMFIRGFRRSLRASSDIFDRVTWLFCLGVFLTFTISGRITETSYAIGFVLLLMLPVARSRS